MTTIVLASTLYGVATAATILDNEPADRADRRLLVVANNAAMAEIVPDVNQIDGFAALADRFDEIVSLNALIAPYHPSAWRPTTEDTMVLGRLLRSAWGVGDEPVRLMLESIQVRPAQTIAALFPEAPITIYADGLLSYGPTRNNLASQIAGRIERLVLPDLVPGLAPLLLGEHGVPAEVFPIEMLGKTLAAMAEVSPLTCDPPVSQTELALDHERVAVVIGQYLGSLGILAPAEEQGLHVRMLAAARRLGATRVLFKPHPGSAPTLMAPLREWAADAGLAFNVVTSRALVETLLDRIRPYVVVSGFSTALVTARRLHGVPCVTVGVSELLRRLRPYANSNRIPLVIVEAITPDGEAVDPTTLADWEPPDAATLTERVRAVGYLMQPRRRPDLRPTAEAVLDRTDAAALAPGISRRRLTRMGLPGGFPGRSALYRFEDTVAGHLSRDALLRARRQGVLKTLRQLRR